MNLNTARVTYKNLLTFWAKTTANFAIHLLLFPGKLFSFLQKLAHHNSIGMKDYEVGNETRLDRKERRKKEKKGKKLAGGHAF